MILSKEVLVQFIKALPEKICILLWKKRRQIYYILLRKITAFNNSMNKECGICGCDVKFQAAAADDVGEVICALESEEKGAFFQTEFKSLVPEKA